MQTKSLKSDSLIVQISACIYARGTLSGVHMVESLPAIRSHMHVPCTYGVKIDQLQVLRGRLCNVN